IFAHRMTIVHLLLYSLPPRCLISWLCACSSALIFAHRMTIAHLLLYLCTQDDHSSSAALSLHTG
ncbi:predicted protein, partial [Nematostella vectensis]